MPEYGYSIFFFLTSNKGRVTACTVTGIKQVTTYWYDTEITCNSERIGHNIAGSTKMVLQRQRRC